MKRLQLAAMTMETMMASRAWSRASIISRLFGTPLAVLPETAAIVLGAVGPKLDVGQLFVAPTGAALSIDEMRSMAAAEVNRLESVGPTDRAAPLHRANRLGFVFNRVMHVPIRGETVSENDGAIGPSSGFTGYDGIRAQVIAADKDPEIGGILLDVDCPGGEVASLFELADFLMSRRGTKPMRAMIRDCGCSAAYTIAACADPGQVTMHALGRAGSNGVITMHADFSEQLAQEGIKVRLFASGTHKAEGNPFEPLPEEVAARISAMVEVSASRLFKHVGKARGMSAEDIRKQQAQVYFGDEAVKAGLVDKIMSWDDSMQEFEQQVNGTARSRTATAPSGVSSSKGKAMSTEATAPAAEQQPIFTQAQLDQAVASASASATADANLAMANSERARFAALAELDGGSKISAEMATAMAEGTSAGDFAIAQAKAAKAKAGGALSNARADAVDSNDLPESGASAVAASVDQQPTNRGAAFVDKRKAAAAAK
ncbi:S49 family peptidase [Sphingorhabdus pulchriflava]|nr:S49 family peptidase [Sphingorhabdus pulchriflava]